MAAAADFDVLLSADRNMEFQQNVAKLPIAIVIMLARSNRFEDLAKLIPALLRELNHLQPRTLKKVAA